MENTKKTDCGCPVEATLGVIGGKLKPTYTSGS